MSHQSNHTDKVAFGMASKAFHAMLEPPLSKGGLFHVVTSELNKLDTPAKKNFFMVLCEAKFKRLTAVLLSAKETPLSSNDFAKIITSIPLKEQRDVDLLNLFTRVWLTLLIRSGKVGDSSKQTDKSEEKESKGKKPAIISLTKTLDGYLKGLGARPAHVGRAIAALDEQAKTVVGIEEALEFNRDALNAASFALYSETLRFEGNVDNSEDKKGKPKISTISAALDQIMESTVADSDGLHFGFTNKFVTIFNSLTSAEVQKNLFLKVIAGPIVRMLPMLVGHDKAFFKTLKAMQPTPINQRLIPLLLSTWVFHLQSIVDQSPISAELTEEEGDEARRGKLDDSLVAVVALFRDRIDLVRVLTDAFGEKPLPPNTARAIRLLPMLQRFGPGPTLFQDNGQKPDEDLTEITASKQEY